MTPYKEPPLMKIYFGHATGTAALGALLPSGEHLQSLHAFVSPLILKIPGAVALTKQASDPVFAQVFLALSLLIAICVLVGAVWHVSRGGYHTKTFETAAKKRMVQIGFWALTAFLIAVFWNVPYTTDGAQDRIYFLIKAPTSSTFGVLTAMNLLLVGGPLIVVLTAMVAPFCTDVRRNNL